MKNLIPLGLLFWSSIGLTVDSQEPLPSADPQEYKAGRLLAIVGREHILASDILAQVEPMLVDAKDKYPQDEIDRARQQLMRKGLVEYITTKILAQRFVRDMVGNKPAKDIEEAQKKVNPKIAKSFYEKRLPQLIEDFKVSTELELEQKLRDQGSSISAMLRQFGEQALAYEAIQSNVPKNPPIELIDLREYYQEHAEEWNKPARARWRQISAHTAKHGSPEKAAAALANMGNEILYGGTPFEVVAKRGSDDFSASNGGVYEWTSKDSLRSKAIDEVVFLIELKKLSRPISDDQGFHIVEVLEREDAMTIPLDDVQLQIREKLVEARKATLRTEFIAKVKRESLIWTVWPEDFPGSRPLAEAVQGLEP